MKFPITLLISLPLIATACKKDKGQDVDNGCIERVYINKNDHAISSADIATVNRLFADNNISNSNFRYTRYRQDSLQTQFPPYEKVEYKQVRVNDYLKGLRIIDSDVIFVFTKDVFTYTSGAFQNMSVNDVTPQLSLPRLRKLFLDDEKNARLYPNDNYADTCLRAEFGLYEIRGTGNSLSWLVKAWLVTGQNNSYPRAVYKDNGTRIFYDNGIRTIH
ncbi:MAG TPA: hypothetical protein VIM79_02610 [Niastella sp.]